MPMLPPLALTSGEPAGIGPDLCVMLAAQPLPARVVVLADREVLAARAAARNIPFQAVDYVPGQIPPPGYIEVLHLPCTAPVVPGQLDPRNSPSVLRLLDRALDGCLAGEFAAMVTAPVHKGVINDAGIPFSGHTEYLADRSRTPRVVMMLTGGGLRVALATTHLPLKDVAAAIQPEELAAVIRILHTDLQQKFGISRPRILVAGLNPHAGESGHLGREEVEIISPVLDRLRQEGLDLVGPLPADTLFTPRQLAGSDAQLAMYHDQGLAVLKYASFGEGVNVTLGLPVIRTSVDHGTALDLAGGGPIDTGSLRAAITLAATLSTPETP